MLTRMAQGLHAVPRPITVVGLAALAPAALLAALLAASWAGAANAQSSQAVYPVQAEGVAGYEPGDPTGSREAALEAALRNGVEQVSGVMIESESRMKNFALVKDEVLSHSKGFIKSYQVIKEGRQGDLYKVLVKALVVKAALIKELDASLETLYRRVGKPRVMVVIREQALNTAGKPRPGGASGHIAEKEIRKLLIKQGFTFIDARAAAGISLLEVALKGEQIVRDKVIEAALTAKAEIVMLGTAIVRDKGAKDSFFMAQADLSLDVVRVDSGQVMASEVAAARGLDVNQETAGVKAVQKAAREIAPRMMAQVSYLWIKDRSEGGRIELVVKNASFGDVLALKRALSGRISGVKQLKQRSFKKGVALFEFQSRKTVEQIAESLYEQKFEKFSLEIENLSSKTLTVSLEKKEPKPVAAKQPPPPPPARSPPARSPPTRPTTVQQGQKFRTNLAAPSEIKAPSQ